MSTPARALLDALRECKTSPTVLFLLRLPLPYLVKTDVGELLRDFCQHHSVSLARPLPSEFFSEVAEAVAAFAPVPGSFYVVEKCKAEAVRRFSDSLRARRAKDPSNRFLYLGAAMPTCFQTLRGRSDGVKETTDSLFVVHSAPENALLQAVEILKQGHFVYRDSSVIPVMQVYEMRLHEPVLTQREGSRFGYLIVDWELRRSEVRGRLTDAQIEELRQAFPLHFYRKMVERRHVDRDAVVLAAVKTKSRAVPDKDDFKHSMHVTYSVFGLCQHLEHVFRDCFRETWGELSRLRDKCDKVRAQAFFDKAGGRDCIADFPEVGLDKAGITGKTGVAMLGSRKSDRDPYSALAEQWAFSRGEVHVFPRPKTASARPACNPSRFYPLPENAQHDFSVLSTRDAVRLMYEACCSVPKLAAVPVTAHCAEKSEERQSRTALRHHATPGAPLPAQGGAGSARAPAGSLLAALPEELRRYVSGSTERHSAAYAYAMELQRLGVRDADPAGWNVKHFKAEAQGSTGMPCVVKLADRQDPKLHYHSNNGAILAVNSALPGVVFARCACATCSISGPTNEDVERVRSQHDTLSNWFSLTGESFARLLQKIDRKTVQLKETTRMVKKQVRDDKKRKVEWESARAVKQSYESGKFDKCKKST